MNKKILSILEKEKNRQNNTIELIASENFVSSAVMKLTGSCFTNKYAEGYPNNRYYNGCENMDDIENFAIEQLKMIYGCNFANVQPHSGANANTAVYQAFLKPNDTILGMDLSSGGHLSHGSPVNISGKLYNVENYKVNNQGWLDYDDIEKKAIKTKPKIIIAGASSYPRQINWAKFKEIALKSNSMLMVDMAHYSGLIAGGSYLNPMEYADVVTSTTHKTLRGPRGGIILWNNPKYTKKINSSIFPGTQGGPLMNIIAAKAQAFSEANTKEFSFYTNSVVKNAKAMCDVFISNNIKISTNGTDSHIILINLSDKNYSGKHAADLLEKNGITVNKNSIPNDSRNFLETSGIRIGTAAETTKGHDEKWFKDLAQKISNILLNE